VSDAPTSDPDSTPAGAGEAETTRLAEVEGPPPAQVRRGGVPVKSGAAALTVGALGVVFGDIGTSPLYALHAVFSEEHIRPTQPHVYGVISLVFWAITTIVSVKYVTFIMRADNDGEGGIMALIALVQTALKDNRARGALIGLGIFGAALFYGDGMITPAISVLSAVEGLKVVSPNLESLVIPITLVILTVLFVIQRYGTGAVGRWFGPVMFVWFSVLAAGGIGQIAQDPGVFKALSPSYAVQFFSEDFGIAFLSLGGVVLAVTGAEALYADMGHFGRSPIRRAWFLFVFPALTLNYLGQGSLILHSPNAVANPFFLLFPDWARIPMVVLATFATVIASQAVISGAFSVTRQAMQLGFLPRLTIHHTSEREIGQVYAPAVNGMLYVAVVALVVGFGSSAALAAAYGIAVTGTLAIDTILFFVVVRALWGKPWWMVAGGLIGFLTVDLAFLGANVPKIVHGGWFPLMIGAVLFTVLTTWQRGREIVSANRTKEEGPLQKFVDYLHEVDPPLYRPPVAGVFLNSAKATTPLAMRAIVEHNRTLHESVVIISIETLKVPHVDREDRLTIDELGYTDDGIAHVTACFGFQDDPNVPGVLRLAAEMGLECDIDVDTCSYFLSQITVVRTTKPGMARWRKQMFLDIARLSASPVAYFGLPLERTVTIGSHIDF
jgi:KUP system potassium uptake protein